jgi:regulator of protease activity HflC (stomatin/prohibitin superfamily)
MFTTAIVIGACALFGTLWASSMVMFVKEKQDVLIESFGKYVKTVKTPGLKFKLPWPFQTVANRISTAMIESKEELQTKTKDDIFVTLPIKMHLEVEDSKKYNYESNDPERQVMSRIAATVKQLSSNMDFAELYQARETISDSVREKVGEELNTLYGVKMIDVIVDEPHAPAEIQASYNNVKASERNMLATKNNAEARKIETIANAEAHKESLRLNGEGIAAQRKAIFENYSSQFNNLVKDGMPPEMTERIILLAMQNDTVRDAGAKGNVILVNTSANSTLAEIQALGKTLSKKPDADNDNESGSAPKMKTGM